MEAKLFTLVNADNDAQIFAWGMEITDDECTDAAVIYRRDPATGRPVTGVHSSAESALRLWARIAPMELHWEITPEDVLEQLANLAP